MKVNILNFVLACGLLILWSCDNQDLADPSAIVRHQNSVSHASSQDSSSIIASLIFCRVRQYYPHRAGVIRAWLRICISIRRQHQLQRSVYTLARFLLGDVHECCNRSIPFASGLARHTAGTPRPPRRIGERRVSRARQHPL